jgi:hypothetical protein
VRPNISSLKQKQRETTFLSRTAREATKNGVMVLWCNGGDGSWCRGASSGVRRHRREADLSPSSTAEVKNQWSPTSTSNQEYCIEKTPVDVLRARNEKGA